MVYNKLGLLYERLNQFERAIGVYEKAVKEGAITPFTYERLSALHLDAGRLDEALEDYRNRGIRSLKKAHTDFFQEIYFWFVFQGLKYRIKRRDSGSLKG